MCPTTITLALYAYTVPFIRLLNQIQQYHRRNANTRDLVVQKRIIILGQSAFSISVIHWSIDNLTSMPYNTHDLMIIVRITAKILLLALIPPQIRGKLHRNRGYVLSITLATQIHRKTNTAESQAPEYI